MRMKHLFFPTLFWLPICHSYCTGHLRDRHIAGIWRLRSKDSFLPKFEDDFSKRPLKEFTVYPPKKTFDKENAADDIILLLKEDGKFVQYGSPDDNDGKKQPLGTQVIDRTSCMGTMTGSWALVDGELILAADRAEDTTNIRSESKKHDTILIGQVKATSGKGLEDNPTLLRQLDDRRIKDNDNVDNNSDEKGKENSGKSMQMSKEDVHLSVSGEISIGKFFYPKTHPNFFEQPMATPTPTGSFELKQILGSLNTKVDSDEDKLVEKFRKPDLMNKRYFLTSYPMSTKRRQKKQRWSIKYNKYVDERAKSEAEKQREEREDNAPMQIKSFEVELFANNTFSTITGLGDTILRGKWSIIGKERDHLWMSVFRFGFGRNVSGSTFSEGSHLTHQDEVSYWGEINEVDTAKEEDCIMDDPCKWKGTKIVINGAVMLGVGLEPCSVARFTMIEKTEDDSEFEENDDENLLDDLPLDVGSFE